LSWGKARYHKGEVLTAEDAEDAEESLILGEATVPIKAIKANLPQYDLSQIAPQGFTG
jgi:hypothetical protein